MAQIKILEIVFSLFRKAKSEFLVRVLCLTHAPAAISCFPPTAEREREFALKGNHGENDRGGNKSLLSVAATIS